MSDIVERLDRLRMSYDRNSDVDTAMLDAMEAIICLRKERSELLEALRLCVAVLENGADDLGAKDAAIAALSKAQGGGQ